MEDAFRFLKRLWRTVSLRQRFSLLQQWTPESLQSVDWNVLGTQERDIRAQVHGLLQQANRDVAKYQFNTVVAAGMKIINTIQPLQENITEDENKAMVYADSVQIMLRLLAPIVPHICHSLWSGLGYANDITEAGWPQVDEAALVSDSISLVLQVNGKLRGRVEVPSSADKVQIETTALQDENVRRHVEDKQIVKIVVVPGRLVNIVVK